MCVNFTIPTASMCPMTHQIATITTAAAAGDPVGAQDADASQVSSKFFFFFFFFFGTTNIFFFFIQTTCTCTTPLPPLRHIQQPFKWPPPSPQHNALAREGRERGKKPIAKKVWLTTCDQRFKGCQATST